LIEPIEYTDLNKFKNGNPFKVIHTILNDYDGEVDWYEMKNTGDSIKKERTSHFNKCLPLKKECTKLDTLFKNEKYDLIKIDVQGSEMNVLEGGKEMIKHTSFIIMEMPFFCQYNENTPNFLSHIQKMDELGFIPYDIVSEHRHKKHITISSRFLFYK